MPTMAIKVRAKLDIPRCVSSKAFAANAVLIHRIDVPKVPTPIVTSQMPVKDTDMHRVWYDM